MSNEPKTVPKFVYVFVNYFPLLFLLVLVVVEHVFNLTFWWAVLWCLPLIPVWWFVQKRFGITFY